MTLNELRFLILRYRYSPKHLLSDSRVLIMNVCHAQHKAAVHANMSNSDQENIFILAIRRLRPPDVRSGPSYFVRCLQRPGLYGLVIIASVAPPVPIPNTEVKPLSADGTWS